VVVQDSAVFSGDILENILINCPHAGLDNVVLAAMDEATSHLDTVTEESVQRNLREPQCTRIVIAHRLSTVREAGCIVVVDRGRIVEKGTHDELFAAGGAYAELVRGRQTSLASGRPGF
jgi:ABC-type bacteriocin/lantibiotic exporter with double-glycine peptidase domain